MTYDDWYKNKCKVWNSQWFKELEICLILQGYEDKLFYEYMLMTGSGFGALTIIKNIKEIY